MIIQCEKCETTYRFDSAGLQNGEAQVRCIRCGNVFTVDSLSDLGETFLNTETPAKTQSTPEQVNNSIGVTADAAHDYPADTSFDSIPDASAPQSDFSLETPTEDSQKEEDFWTSPSDFNFDAPDTGTTSEDKSDQTPDSNPNEFIFEPLEQEMNIADVPDPAEETPTQGSPSEQPPGATKRKKSKPKKKGSKLLLVVLLIILIGAGIYAYYFVTYGVTSVPQLIEKAEQQIHQLLNPQPEPAGPSISIRSGDNFYISNDNIGSLFVINGNATNISNQPQGEIAVVATLYDSDGTPLKSIKAFCGNPISKEDLRSEPWESLQERMSNKLGAGLSNVSVQPGESIPFCAVFHNLPEDFAEFSISEAEASVAGVNK